LSERGSGAGNEEFDLASNRRQLVEVRCKFAELARREAEAAEARAASFGRNYNSQLAALKSAQDANPGAVRKVKEEAHRAFRRAVFAAKSREQVEEAATVWLAAINKINATSRAAMLHLHREREAVEALADELDGLTAQAEASRVMADVAAEACRAARESLEAVSGQSSAAASADAARAALTELAAAQATAHAAFASSGAKQEAGPPALKPISIVRSVPGVGVVAGGPTEPAKQEQPPEPEAPVNYRAADPPAIVRLLQGDGRVMAGLAEKLGGADREQQSRWQACLSDFADAVVETAMDQGYFIFPGDHPFWGQFTAEQARELARGLASLGFRYDGQGGFADDRSPGPRDLTLAAGNAGLPTVRVRYWPAVEDAALLYQDVGVDAVEVLVEKAPAATMEQLMHLVGRRSAAMGDLWNDWHRVRPLLTGPARG
jgi:hypothetical protein